MLPETSFNGYCNSSWHDGGRRIDGELLYNDLSNRTFQPLSRTLSSALLSAVQKPKPAPARRDKPARNPKAADAEETGVAEPTARAVMAAQSTNIIPLRLPNDARPGMMMKL